MKSLFLLMSKIWNILNNIKNNTVYPHTFTVQSLWPQSFTELWTLNSAVRLNFLLPSWPGVGLTCSPWGVSVSCGTHSPSWGTWAGDHCPPLDCQRPPGSRLGKDASPFHPLTLPVLLGLLPHGRHWGTYCPSWVSLGWRSNVSLAAIGMGWVFPFPVWHAGRGGGERCLSELPVQGGFPSGLWSWSGLPPGGASPCRPLPAMLGRGPRNLQYSHQLQFVVFHNSRVLQEHNPCEFWGLTVYPNLMWEFFSSDLRIFLMVHMDRFTLWVGNKTTL